VYAILDSGEIASYRIKQKVRVRAADVEEFLERSKVRPGDLRHLYPAGDGDPPER
jgi:hypothetical protein